ncbi:MAG: Gfo/Idh/MocA family oxidoreductase [Gemmatales bacterium]|nr:Gfo/Idh/MocA family oxidoreductase [Gemmatales bacterium]MCS7160331.1 Gfo/Idh/MocA family oxidoreductase [Gemmatales bacterium]MDW8175531.1 Gfo/Idh/MocA family oxidoreductase [Gemmatales bacterium]MDW8221556.1 Gfo/Idh/MocA family oxidoreductase [Gemmatales bacterium]
MATAAVIGTGFIGPVHIEALRRLGITVRGVLASTAEKSQRAAQRWQLPRAYRSLDELLADSEVDVVHITSPNRFHYEHAVQALQAGKHVICEKPLALNSQQSSDLVRRAQTCGKVCAVCYNIRYYPLCQEARHRIAQGQIGRIFHVLGSYQQDWLLFPTDYNWRVLASEGGAARAVGDIGTHWLDLVSFLLGQAVVSVCADLRTIWPKRRRPLGSTETFQTKFQAAGSFEEVPIDTEDFAAILLRFADGTPGMLAVSQVTAGAKNRLLWEIAGEKGALAWNSERPDELWCGFRDQPNQLLLRDPALLSASARACADYPGGHNEGFPDTFKQLFRAIYAAIEQGPTHPASYPTFEDGHREVVLCEAILQSHQQRRWVDISINV